MRFNMILVTLSLATSSLALPGPVLKRNGGSAPTCANTYKGTVQCCDTSAESQNNIWSDLSSLLGVLPFGVIIEGIIPTITCDTVAVIGGALGSVSCGSNTAVCCVPESSASTTQSGLINLNLLPNMNLAVCPSLDVE